VAAVATFAIGCGSSSDRPADAGAADAATPVDGATPIDAPAVIDAPMGDAPAAMIVRGTAKFHHVTDTGIVDSLQDLSSVIYASFTPIAGGFERRAAVGDVDGTFAVPVGFGVPSWQLELGVGQGFPRAFLVSSEPQIDVSAIQLGRPDRQFPSVETPVTINATGLVPWQLTHEIGILSSNAGALVLSTETSASLTPGDTAIANHVIRWPTALVNAAKGDTTLMFQLVGSGPDAGAADFYVALARSGLATGFTMANGTPATMTVALAAVPQSRSLAVQVKRSQFDALRAEVGPGALPARIFEQSLFIFALPRLRELGFFANAPRVLFAFPVAGTRDYDRSFTYGNPFATGGLAWEELAVARYNFAVPVLAAGATTSTEVQVGFVANIPVTELAVDGTIAPVLTPVRNVKIAGKNLATPQTGVGLTPTITWDPPSKGTPSSYDVSVREVTASGAATRVRAIATFTTTSTSLQVPDSVLSSGVSYILVVEANAARDYDSAAPLINGLPSFFATMATAQFTP
jgi:hypothetical protein